MYLKEFCHAQHSYICKVTSFGTFYRTSDLSTRTHERNYAIAYITLEKEIPSYTYMYDCQHLASRAFRLFVYLYRVIHKSVKHLKNSQQMDYAANHGNSYVDRERNC